MLKLDIQMFADGKVVIETDLNTKKFESGLDKIKDTTQKAGSTVKNIVKGLGISKIISVAINEINNSIDGAISRFDTLNNFPKVMSNLGIGADDADKSIKKLSDKLAGLPTTLDEAALSVQRLTSKNGDIEESTDLFLALNNAILAGGASSEIQSSALEQLSQAYAKGKPDMMEWRTAMTAMPAQLKQVARAMGYIDADELGAELREGNVSMDEFMEAIVRLNEEGIDGFQSFEKQARNSTGGIKTSITVAKTQIVKGVTDIISAFNTSFEKTKFGSLSNFISEIGKSSKIGLDEVAKVISGEISLYDFGKEITDFITRMVNSFTENFPRVADTGLKLVLELVNGLLNEQSITNLINASVNLITTILDTFVNHLEDIYNSGLDIVLNLVNGLSDGLPNLIDKMDEILNKLLNKMDDDEFIDKVVQKGGEILIALVLGMLRAIPRLILSLNEIKARINYEISKLPSKFFQIGTDMVIGIAKGFKERGAKAIVDIANWADSVIAKVKKKLKIASPSKRFRDEIGKQMSAGIGVGFEDELSNVYRDMQRAIDMEQEKLVASVETGRVFNTIQNSTPVAISINGDVNMDSQKVGRLVTPTVTRTIKNGGGV